MSARTPRIVHDRTRFPMVWSDAAQAFIGYFPVTKIQLEYFLCDRPGAAFDQRWYESLLKLNERIAPGRIQSDNFYKAFVTGISPVQAKQFAAWLGRESDETYTLLNQGNTRVRGSSHCCCRHSHLVSNYCCKRSTPSVKK